MAWRDRFTAIGSFRGAQFVVRSGDETFGRRVQIHEFPGRDDPQPEDLGLRKKEHSIEVFVSGDHYEDKRDALIEAINKPGPGTLLHPYMGSLNVTITDARKRESTREGGMASFTIGFVITPPVIAPESIDTQIAVELSVAESLTQSIDDFGNVFDMLGAANDLVQGAIDDVDSVMGAVENVVTGVTSNITQLITAPFEMGVAVVGAFNNIRTSLGNPLHALNIYRRLFAAGNELATVPTTTPSRVQQSNSIAAVHRIVQQAAVSSACLMAAEIDYDSLDDAVSLRDELLDAIDAQINAPMSESLYAAFVDMRVALVRDLRVRGMHLPKLRTHTPLATLPALVIAHQLYGDATREAEIVARNKISHPGFVPAGVPLEVLSYVA
jgi:prophage DNA circulation protein